MTAAAASRPAFAQVDIEPMRQRHLPAVLAIEQRTYPRPWTPGLFASELQAGPTRRYYVALASSAVTGVTASLRRGLGLGRRVVGYGGIMVQVGEAHVTTVAVHPEHHRRKIASRLLLRLLQDARDMGADAATLEVRIANLGAQRLYSAFGFVPAGVRPGYYAETSEDALIMWAHDLQGRDMAERLREQAARLDLPGGSSGQPDHDVPWVQGRIGLADTLGDTGQEA